MTGNRRFWIVKCRQTDAVKRFSFTEEERDQIWAEALHLWKHGETLWLEGELLEASVEVQKEAMEADDRSGLVDVYLRTLLPENWPKMNIYERRNWLLDVDDPTRPKGTVRREFVSNPEIWSECFGKNPAEMKFSDSYAIAAIMVQMDGWERTRERAYIPLYGRQRLYRRHEDIPDFLQ